MYRPLSVEVGDVLAARKLVHKLKERSFYEDCSDKAKNLYTEMYSEEVFIKKLKDILV